MKKSVLILFYLIFSLYQMPFAFSGEHEQKIKILKIQRDHFEREKSQQMALAQKLMAMKRPRNIVLPFIERAESFDRQISLIDSKINQLRTTAESVSALAALNKFPFAPSTPICVRKDPVLLEMESNVFVRLAGEKLDFFKIKHSIPLEVGKKFNSTQGELFQRMSGNIPLLIEGLEYLQKTYVKLNELYQQNPKSPFVKDTIARTKAIDFALRTRLVSYINSINDLRLSVKELSPIFGKTFPDLKILFKDLANSHLRFARWSFQTPPLEEKVQETEEYKLKIKYDALSDWFKPTNNNDSNGGKKQSIRL